MIDQKRPIIALGLFSGGIGGGQKVALSVAGELIERAFSVEAISPGDGWITDRIRAYGASVHFVGPIRSYQLLKAARLAILMRRRGVACLYTHTGPSQEIVFAAAAKLGGVRLVLHRHIVAEFSHRPTRRFYQEMLWKWVLRVADDVVCVSPEVAEQVRRFGARRVEIVPNGVRVPETRGPSSSYPVMGYVGRLAPSKRVTDFIEAASLVRRSHQNARFMIVGPGAAGGDYERECRELATRLELNDVLQFTGGVPDATELMQSMDIVALPSSLEGHPLVLLEAMALGKTVVASDIPACREVVTDGETGCLVRPGAPTQLAEVVGRLLDSAEERERLGRAARQRVLQSFQEDHMTERIVEILEKVLRDG